jgi:hypothetical protein
MKKQTKHKKLLYDFSYVRGKPDLLWDKFKEISVGKICRIESLRESLNVKIEEMEQNGQTDTEEYKTLCWKRYKANYWINELIRINAWLKREMRKTINVRGRKIDRELKIIGKIREDCLKRRKKNNAAIKKFLESSRDPAREAKRQTRSKMGTFLKRGEALQKEMREINKDFEKVHTLLDEQANINKCLSTLEECYDSMYVAPYYDDFDNAHGFHKGDELEEE